MTSKPDSPATEWMDGVAAIVADPLRFKMKLDIGEDAYQLLRVRNTVQYYWDTAGAAATGGALASSQVVATTFFAHTGFWATLGLAGAATTPLGWVIAASLVSGAAWAGLTHISKQASSKRVRVIPEFINTPIDILGLGLFRLIAPLALKVAHADNEIHASERAAIRDEFVQGWGYDAAFVDAGLRFIESQLEVHTVENTAEALADLQKSNPDCNYESMSQAILRLLQTVIEADGRLTETEERAVASVKRIFTVKGRSFVHEKLLISVDATTKAAKNSGEAILKTSAKARQAVSKASEELGRSTAANMQRAIEQVRRSTAKKK